MNRIALILALSACSASKADAPKTAAPVVVAKTPADAGVDAAPPPVNAVCKAFQGVNGTAKCEPGHTDVGELHVHTATVTLGQQSFACRADLGMLGVLCGDPIVIKQTPPPPVVDSKPVAKKK